MSNDNHSDLLSSVRKETAVVKDAFRRHLEKALDVQEDHPVYQRVEVLWDESYDITSVMMRAGNQARRCGPDEVIRALENRKKLIQNEKDNPYRHGFEPEFWHEADWRLAELRCAFPGQPVTLGILGGNGGGKSFYASKRFAQCMQENENWLCIQLSLDEDSSEEIAQALIYYHLDASLKTATGKAKRTANQRMTYNVDGGFTDNSFSLENKCRANFKFYGGGDVNAMEGPRPDLVWADEMVPTDWVRAAIRRLVTKAEKSLALIPQLKEALAARGRGEADAYDRYLKPLIPKLFQGVCVVSFTPKNGYTQTVNMLVGKAKTLWEVDAELLPIKAGVTEGSAGGPEEFHRQNPGPLYEKVPRVMYNEEEQATILFFHIYDNPYGGNWEAQKALLAKKSRDEILWRAYGVATKIAGVQLPLFGREAHVRPHLWLPKTGTWYHIVDPTDGRNWCMIWAKVCPNPVGPPLIWVAREWPQPGDWIVAGGVGDPGDWAVLDDSGRADGRKKSGAVKMDGERGPAQRLWGLGFRQMAEEIERVERELYKLEMRIAGDPDWETADGRIEVLEAFCCRIMDSRAANAETQQHGESQTLLQAMQEYGLFFTSAGRDSGAEAGTTTIREGIGMIVDRLFFDRDKVVLTPDGIYRFNGQAPSLFISEVCKNLIFCASNWTGQDGQKGAMKDFIDLLRYLVIANPMHIESLEWTDGGGVY
jgi:hypothetical protein